MKATIVECGQAVFGILTTIIVVAVFAWAWITLFGLGENDSPSHGTRPQSTSTYDPSVDSGNSLFCSGGIEC